MAITTVVNGSSYEAPRDGTQTLLGWLRDEVGLTGPKLGCGEGSCGACTVLVGSRAVQACQVAAVSVAEQRITTVEGLAEDGIMHPVQQAWLEMGALQCGFCSAGWLTGAAALLARVPRPDDARINAELAGHVCRCCTYPRIRRAIHRAAELMAHPDLLEPVPPGTSPAASLAPEEPWDLARARPRSFADAMPAGLLTVVADEIEGGGEPGFDGPDDAWVHVGADGSITAFTGKVEAGQGTRTALGLLVAEELAVPPGRVRVVMADTDVSPFDHGTFGSRAMPHAAPPLRAAAAAAFRMLLDAAAERFGLPPGALTGSDGIIAGPDGAPSVSYGDLVAGLRRVEVVPADAPVTPATAWRRSAGKPARAAGAEAAVAGRKLFPSDLRREGMLHGRVLHAPEANVTLRAADTATSAAMPGVTVVSDESITGVVAPDEQSAAAALAAINADWTSPEPGPSPADLASYLRANVGPGTGRNVAVVSRLGEPESMLEAGAVRIAETYQVAYVAHVPLEPRSALASWDGGSLTVWAATSTPFRARAELAAELGVSEEAVHVIVPDFGGGFGGKHGSMVALEAARLARAAGRPVQVKWSMEDEFRAGYLRPAAVIDVASSADAKGGLLAWSFTNILSGSAALATPYLVPNQVIRYQPSASPLNRGSYRALAATANNFARESHMDEMAHALGLDPVTFRLNHLEDDRLAAVLETVASEIGRPPGSRTGTGVAIGFEKGGRVATAARISVGDDGTVTVDSLVTAVDVGAIVNPDGLANQVEGCVAMGLGPALFEQIDFAGGRILNASMSQYRVPRLADVPVDLKVILIDRPDQPSAGGGEAPIMAVAPAIANAIFDATGVRLRSMPLIPGGRLQPRPTAASWPGGPRPAASRRP